jgi:pimeloyl-ACP methyl ester carboxylesterase
MPYLTVNTARLFYETYGPPTPSRCPIVLIHGSTSTGFNDWSAMAPRLATAGYHVVVPDCRGHGQSENRKNTYAFKEMAADTAALIRALGHDTAHLIGHSNGGNVVLVALMEHPEVVRTCIPQAANGYVSPDLIEKEPPLFDPDRVARESPAWMEEMQRLHGPTHGPGYWRDLLRLTVQEIITEPNYTPADLARVQRPVFVIQGAEDGVNATGRHAQYLAENIPAAELWLPPSVGHTVHEALPDEWLARVTDFLSRRGGTPR